MRKKIITAIIATTTVLALSACGDKAMEQYQDAPIGQRDTTGADIVNMPDGYANLATKCNNGNRVYVTTTGQMQGESGSAARAVAVVPNDPSCKGL